MAACFALPRLGRRLGATAGLAVLTLLPLANAQVPNSLAKDAAMHVLRRMTFGPTPALLGTVPNAIPAYIAQQLAPASITESANAIALFNDIQPPAGTAWTISRLQFDSAARKIFSNKQLQERLVWFWENHFNTGSKAIINKRTEAEAQATLANGFYNLGKSFNLAVSNDDEFAATLEQAENSGFRQHALGKFKDLLKVSARSAAMLIYLDGFKNLPPLASNENHARELLELHTVGVDPVTGQNRFAESDVGHVAGILSGWIVVPDPIMACSSRMLASTLAACIRACKRSTRSTTRVGSRSCTWSGIRTRACRTFRRSTIGRPGSRMTRRRRMAG